MGKISCEACKKSCKGQAIRLQERYYHVKCFKCHECKKQLAAGGFYTHDDLYYCADDYQRLFGVKCGGCGRYVEGEVITALGSSYHPECFHCTLCNAKFGAGDKVTFNGEHYLCGKCLARSEAGPDMITPPESPIKPSLSPLITSTPHTKSEDVNDAVDGHSPIENDTYTPGTDEEKHITPTAFMPVIEKYTPKFNVDYGKFYNASYLEKQKQVDGAYKRAPPADSGEPQHFHRPDNFSYSRVRTDFIKPAVKRGNQDKELPTKGDPYKPDKKQESVCLSKKPLRPDEHLDPIERDDWPGPPCAAAAFPELFYDRSIRQQLQSKQKKEPEVPPAETNGVATTPDLQPSSPDVSGEVPADVSHDETDNVDGTPNKSNPKVEREIEELSRLSLSSGAANVMLRDLQKTRAVSPTLDPISASRAPAADREPHYKTRYDNPVFASPSRDSDYRPRTHSMDELLCGRKYRNTTLPLSNLPVDRRAYFYDTPVDVVCHRPAPRPGYGLSPKSSTLPADNHALGYYSDDGLNGHSSSHDELHRPKYMSASMEEFDPNTGLRRHRGRSSNPADAFHTRYVGFRRSIPSVYRGDEAPKIYPYEQLLVSNNELPPDVERNTTEKHLSNDEFEAIFHLSRGEFYRLAEWKQNDMKRRVGLF